MPRLPSVRVILASFLVLGSRASSSAGPSDLLAGTAHVILTPPPNLKAILGGYGARMSKPALGVHDDVWAKALVFTQGERRFALVTADVLAFPPQFKAAVLERLIPQGWQPEQVMLLPSHSHTSIDMMTLHPENVFGIPQVGIFDKAVFALTVERLAQVICEAVTNSVPILAASRTMDVPNRNRNRRSAGGVHDSNLTVTRVDTTRGTPCAVLVNWTAHPTFMDAEDMWFSGDWPGHLQRTLEALIGQGITVLFYNGAEGDQSPTPPLKVDSHWERAERYGRELGITAWRMWEKLQPEPIKQFAYHTEPISLPKRRPHPDFMKTGGAEYGLNETMAQGFLERLLPTQTHSTAFRLGELLILGVPGEMAAQLGLDVKSTASNLTGVQNVTIGGLADEWVSYILPAEEYRKGGYEASMSSYGDNLANIIVEGMIQSVRGLK